MNESKGRLGGIGELSIHMMRPEEREYSFGRFCVSHSV